ncbi:MAG: hypothetical protein M3R15_19010, partial [Acidobacteriota bacterium]|nr:hypothetical protein [Acidobacteriota bacterium]
MSTTHCHKSTLIILVIAWVLTFTVGAPPHPTIAASKRPRQKRATVKRRPVAPVTSPVTLMQPQPPDYLSGEASVQVHGNRTPIVRLGMAQHGVTIIEFPASDRFFAIHPGDSEMVTVEDSPTKAKDRFMVLRAGSGFIAPSPTSVAQFSTVKQKKQPPRSLPATSIVVQMQSGLVLTFMIYPVAMLSQQAHRCVISYSRSEVIEARRSAGLAVNLDGTDPTAPVTTAAVVTTTPSPMPATATPTPNTRSMS